MRFEIGDFVVPNLRYSSRILSKVDLTFGKQYKILSVSDELVEIKDDKGRINKYDYLWFSYPPSEFRDQAV